MTKKEFMEKLIATAEKSCDNRKFLDDLYKEKARIEQKIKDEK